MNLALDCKDGGRGARPQSLAEWSGERHLLHWYAECPSDLQRGLAPMPEHAPVWNSAHSATPRRLVVYTPSTTLCRAATRSVFQSRSFLPDALTFATGSCDPETLHRGGHRVRPGEHEHAWFFKFSAPEPYVVGDLHPHPLPGVRMVELLRFAQRRRGLELAAPTNLLQAHADVRLIHEVNVAVDPRVAEQLEHNAGCAKDFHAALPHLEIGRSCELHVVQVSGGHDLQAGELQLPEQPVVVGPPYYQIDVQRRAAPAERVQRRQLLS